MLPATKLKAVEELIASSTREELVWMNGYIQGLLAQGRSQDAAKPSIDKITIVYGTETGNAKQLASGFAARLKKAGITTKLAGLDQYRLADLPKEKFLLCIISTQGEGEPPAAAKKFYDHIHTQPLSLVGLKYSVLALGDTSYPLFCKAGEDVDLQLAKSGAQRLIPLQKCDTDYESTAETWFSELLQLWSSSEKKQQVPEVITAKKPAGKKIYQGIIAANINLNDRGSSKETHHIEILAEDVDYLPGDSLGIVPGNPLICVEDIMSLLEMDNEKEYEFRGAFYKAFDLLKNKLNIIYLPERVVQQYAQLARTTIPSGRMGLLDLLKLYPLQHNTPVEQLLAILEPIAPRLYSISSSPEAHQGEVHITVARDRYMLNEQVYYGLCSDYLSQFAVGSTVEFYIHRNNQFRLPSDDCDLIMIGPGTGIAPFRSFLAHRDACGASGRNWLFFGDQHFVSDFLYQLEIQNWLATGSLAKVDLAFSRDQKEKIYVQHKIKKQGREVYRWLQDGAYVYVCGTRDPMSLDVEKALVDVAQLEGQKSEQEAIQWIEQLKEEGRLLKDVY